MREQAAQFRRNIWTDLLLYPQHTLPTAAAPVIVAVGLAVHNHVFTPLPLRVGSTKHRDQSQRQRTTANPHRSPSSQQP